jgi:hypothetical protein
MERTTDEIETGDRLPHGLQRSAQAQSGVNTQRDAQGNLVRDNGGYARSGVNQGPINNGQIRNAPAQPPVSNANQRNGVGR